MAEQRFGYFIKRIGLTRRKSTAVVNESCRAADIGGTAANRVCNAIGDKVRDTQGSSLT